jgi:uncharacterized tellurite resistance protein B-like protein
MSKFDRLLQEYAAMSYEELLTFAKRCLGELSEELAAPGREDTAALSLFAACMGADGKLSRPEHTFISDLTDTLRGYEDTLALIRGLSPDRCRRATDSLADSLPPAKKAALISLCICFMAVDHTVSEDEAEFIRKLMA